MFQFTISESRTWLPRIWNVLSVDRKRYVNGSIIMDSKNMIGRYLTLGKNGARVQDAINTYYEDHDDANSYPLILIHPIGGNILIWHHEISLLVKSGFRVVAYEIRGHHRTGMGKVGAYAMQDLLSDLEHLLDHLSINKCVL